MSNLKTIFPEFLVTSILKEYKEGYITFNISTSVNILDNETIIECSFIYMVDNQTRFLQFNDCGKHGLGDKVLGLIEKLDDRCLVFKNRHIIDDVEVVTHTWCITSLMPNNID